MSELELYQKTYPHESMHIMGHDFKYRYHKHATSNITIVLLTGGIGLSDLFYQHFMEFAKDYSVITFDYAIDYKDNKQLAKAISILLKNLSIKAYLVGQSLGGFVAQVVAKYYPEVVEGLILSNTASLSSTMEESGKSQLFEMLEKQKKALKMIRYMPFGMVKQMMKKAVQKKLQDVTEQEALLMQNMCDEMLILLTKKYELHMINLLVDMENHINMMPDDFKVYKGNVLLILSEDDNTFNESAKRSLIHLMPNPTVITNITGGHLALLLKLDEYAEAVRSFIKEK